MTAKTSTSKLNGKQEAAMSSAAQISVALLLGFFIVGFVGFSPIAVAHNAAHDVRHANAFPCH